MPKLTKQDMIDRIIDIMDTIKYHNEDTISSYLCYKMSRTDIYELYSELKAFCKDILDSYYKEILEQKNSGKENDI